MAKYIDRADRAPVEKKDKQIERAKQDIHALEIKQKRPIDAGRYESAALDKNTKAVGAGDPCALCGRAVKEEGRHQIHKNVFNKIVHVDAKIKDSEDLGWHSVGPECAKKLPAGYVAGGGVSVGAPKEKRTILTPSDYANEDIITDTVRALSDCASEAFKKGAARGVPFTIFFAELAEYFSGVSAEVVTELCASDPDARRRIIAGAAAAPARLGVWFQNGAGFDRVRAEGILTTEQALAEAPKRAGRPRKDSAAPQAANAAGATPDGNAAALDGMEDVTAAILKKLDNWLDANADIIKPKGIAERCGISPTQLCRLRSGEGRASASGEKVLKLVAEAGKYGFTYEL